MAMQLPGAYSNKATGEEDGEGQGEDGKQGKRGKKGLKTKQQPDDDNEDDDNDNESKRRELAPSRLIVEFAVSNHNVLKQQRDKKQKEKTVKELSITQKSQEEGEEEVEKKKKKGGKKAEKREFFDITSKEKNHAKMRFGRKRTGKIRGDYDKERKKSNTSNKHMGKRLRTRI